jgi:hypothetical protein
MRSAADLVDVEMLTVSTIEPYIWGISRMLMCLVPAFGDCIGVGPVGRRGGEAALARRRAGMSSFVADRSKTPWRVGRSPCADDF